MVTDFTELAMKIGQELRTREWKIVTAESCTGGLVAQILTAVPGASKWFDRGFITYTPESKQEVLGVQASSIKQFGVVSEQVAKEMAVGAKERSHATVSIAVTGYAGPAGGIKDCPVGTVCFAWAVGNQSVLVEQHRFQGDRDTIRKQSGKVILTQLLLFLNQC